MSLYIAHAIMEELPQDLGLALEDPSLKHDSDEPLDLSGSDMKIDAYRRRKMRKRRPANASSSLQANISSNINPLNNSPKSSSSLEETTRSSRYVESFTANCSEETDERPRRQHQMNGTISRNLDRSHHKRVYKQAKPCNCESDSHAENAPIYPRKQRKKKLKRITVDSSDTGMQQDTFDSKLESRMDWKSRRKPLMHSSEGTCLSQNLSGRSRSTRRHQISSSCGTCAIKLCGQPLEQIQIDNDIISKSLESTVTKSLCNDEWHSICRCVCHRSLGKDESSLSGSSCNSDTDSANFTPDDIGGDGDDEMTDFYAEADGGPVLGIPRQSYLSWLKPTRFKDEKLWSYKMNKMRIDGDAYLGNDINGSSNMNIQTDTCRLPGRQSKFSKKSLKHARRHRRMKVKKIKDKNLKDHDLNSLNKLSLGNRNKRIRLDGVKDSNVHCNKQDWEPNKGGFSHYPSTNFSNTNFFSEYFKGDVEMNTDDRISSNGRNFFK